APCALPVPEKTRAGCRFRVLPFGESRKERGIRPAGAPLAPPGQGDRDRAAYPVTAPQGRNCRSSASPDHDTLGGFDGPSSVDTSATTGMTTAPRCDGGFTGAGR